MQLYKVCIILQLNGAIKNKYYTYKQTFTTKSIHIQKIIY